METRLKTVTIWLCSALGVLTAAGAVSVMFSVIADECEDTDNELFYVGSAVIALVAAAAWALEREWLRTRPTWLFAVVAIATTLFLFALACLVVSANMWDSWNGCAGLEGVARGLNATRD